MIVLLAIDCKGITALSSITEIDDTIPPSSSLCCGLNILSLALFSQNVLLVMVKINSYYCQLQKKVCDPGDLPFFCLHNVTHSTGRFSS